MLTIHKNLFVLTILLYLTSLWTVVATANLADHKLLLLHMSQENGVFESISVVLLFAISVYGIIAVIHERTIISNLKIGLIVGFSFVAFFAGMEEISWGQQLFHFESSAYFLEQNLQQETNFHNLIDGNLFSSIIYTTIYVFGVFIPLFYKIFNSYFRENILLRYFDINPHIILIILFSSIFQLYFYDDLGVRMDMISHISGLLLFAYFIWKSRSDLYLKMHFLFIVVATATSMYSYKIYEFFNMQYEIREAFVVLATLFVFIELIKKEKDEKQHN